MNSIELKALIAGVFFGVWPLFMQRSGLGGHLSTLALSAITFVCVLPFAFSNIGDISNVKWASVIVAGITGAVGILSFNGMLAKATTQNVSTLFIFMMIVQIAIPAIYSIIMNGGKVSLMRLAGFVLAIVSAILLTIREK